MVSLHVVELCDHLQDLTEAEVHQLVGFTPEVLVANEDRIIRVYVRDAIR